MAATVSAHVAAGVQAQDPNETASLVTLGTANTGYTATAEGSTVVARVFDVRQIPLAAGSTDLTVVRVWPQGREPKVAVSRFLRIRTTSTSTTPKATCFITWRE